MFEGRWQHQGGEWSPGPEPLVWRLSPEGIRAGPRTAAPVAQVARERGVGGERGLGRRPLLSSRVLPDLSAAAPGAAGGSVRSMGCPGKQGPGGWGRGSAAGPSPHWASLHRRESHEDVKSPRWNSPCPGAAENQAPNTTPRRKSRSRTTRWMAGAGRTTLLAGEHQPP